MASFYYHTDAGLTAPLAGPLDFAQSVDGSTGAQVATLYFGSASSGRTLRAASNPGVDSIVLSVVDAGAGGSPAGDVTLALEPTFSGRVGGAPLDIGVQVNSGAANAVPIYVRVQDSTGVIGINTDISLTATLCEET